MAAGALESFGSSALVRSVVVAGDRRGAGLGRIIVEELEKVAREARIGRLILLTQTAAEFFAHQGYRVIERTDVPQDVQGSAEFRSLCPASAICMMKATLRLTGRAAMADRPYNVLFLCTGNSARSIIAEALINQWGRGKFRGFSAGSHPKGTVHPIALQLLQRLNLPTEGLRSKSWDEFAAPGAAPLDFVFTVCDNAAGEVCPVLARPADDRSLGRAGPGGSRGHGRRQMGRLFGRPFRLLDNRIKIFTSLPLASLDRIKLQSAWTRSARRHRSGAHGMDDA